MKTTLWAQENLGLPEEIKDAAEANELQSYVVCTDAPGRVVCPPQDAEELGWAHTECSHGWIVAE